MYIELKSGHGDDGPARIGRVRFSKTGRTIYYQDKALQRCGLHGFGANYFDVATGEDYWVSGPKQNGQDRHSCGKGDVAIDPDVMEEYWRDIRGCDPPKNPYVA